jgi:DNA repair protein RadC
MMDSLGRAEQEELWVLLCDTRNRVIARVQVYRGSFNSACVRIGEVFRDPVRASAAILVVVHNDPRGDPTPGPIIALTRSIVQAGHLLDVAVLDHIIACRGAYNSLRAAGLGF